MATQQQNVWQARSKQQSASRTPQNRSTTASPSPAQQTPNKPAQQPGNFWAQRATQSRESSTGRGASQSAAPAPTASSNSGFNAAEVKAFLARDAQAGFATYKVQESSQSGAKSGGGAWGSSKPNNSLFFGQLAKQIATLEGGG